VDRTLGYVPRESERMNGVQAFGVFQIILAFLIVIAFAQKIGDITLGIVWLTNVFSGFGFILVGKELLAREPVVKKEM